MNMEDDIKILEEYGWTVECESPFEISYKEDETSRATGFAADIVLLAVRAGWLHKPGEEDD